MCYFTSLKYLFLGKAGLPMGLVPLETLLHLHLVAKPPCVRLQDKDACLPVTPQGRSKARPWPTPPAGCLWHLQRDVCLTRVEILNNGSCWLLWQEGKVIYSAGPGMDSNSLKLSGVGLSVCPMGTSFLDHCIPRLIKYSPRNTVNACACFPFLLDG